MNKSGFKKVFFRFWGNDHKYDKIPLRAILKRQEKREIEEYPLERELENQYDCPDCDHPTDLCVCEFRYPPERYNHEW